MPIKNKLIPIEKNEYKFNIKKPPKPELNSNLEKPKKKKKDEDIEEKSKIFV